MADENAWKKGRVAEIRLWAEYRKKISEGARFILELIDLLTAAEEARKEAEASETRLRDRMSELCTRDLLNAVVVRAESAERERDEFKRIAHAQLSNFAPLRAEIATLKADRDRMVDAVLAWGCLCGTGDYDTGEHDKDCPVPLAQSLRAPQATDEKGGER